MKVTPAIVAEWNSWLPITTTRCHLNFKLEGGTIASHINEGVRSGIEVAVRIKNDIGLAKVTRILEVGCSVGFNCVGLAKTFPNAIIYGIEPDREAVKVGLVMAAENDFDNIYFHDGFGESLPFDEDFFDLVVCHTVIEHVNNVDAVISEIERVLSPQGIFHLEAPNYIWPYEPHLGIWCIPLLGKKVTRLFALLQRKSHHKDYLKHLKFVHPDWLQRLFVNHNLVWENRVEKKLDLIFSGNLDSVKSYHIFANILNIIGALGISRVAKRLILLTRLYPSVLYTVRKSPSK